MAEYKHAGPNVENGVVRYADGAVIPNTTDNIDWVEYQAYVDDGGDTDPWKTAQELSDMAEAAARYADIVNAQTTSGVDKYTVEQVETYLDNRFANMTDLAAAKVELRAIFDKIVPFLLR